MSGRCCVGPGGGAETLVFADLELDLLTRDARRGGREIELSPIEFELLEFFLRHPRQVLPRGLIYERVWGLRRVALVELAGRVRRPSAAQARGRWRAPADPDRSRCRLHVAGAMSFRLRLTVLAALAVAVAIVGASFVVYYTDRHELISPGRQRSRRGFGPTAVEPVQPRIVARLQAAGGRCAGQPHRRDDPVTASRARRVQARVAAFVTALQVRVLGKRKPGGSPTMSRPTFITTTVSGVPTRVLTISSQNEAVTISRSLLDVDRNLSRLKWLLLLISLGGVGAAAILGAFVSGRAVAPLRRLTETTERIVETGDLSERTGQRGRDEISRLSTRLDELLATPGGVAPRPAPARRRRLARAAHADRNAAGELRAARRPRHARSEANVRS